MPISWWTAPIMYVGRGRTHPSCCIGASLQQFLYPIERGVAKIKIPTLVLYDYSWKCNNNAVVSYCLLQYLNHFAALGITAIVYRVCCYTRNMDIPPDWLKLMGLKILALYYPVIDLESKTRPIATTNVIEQSFVLSKCWRFNKIIYFRRFSFTLDAILSVVIVNDIQFRAQKLNEPVSP